MNLKWLLLLLVLLRGGFADENRSVTEQVEWLQDERGLHFKKGYFQPIFQGELLFWKGDVDGVAVATTSKETEIAGGMATTNVKTRTPHFSYDPGFRVGVGVQSPGKLLDVSLLWTQFYTEGQDKAHGSLVVGGGFPGDKLILNQIGLIQELVSAPNWIGSKCHIRENLLDLELARGIKASRRFFMRPYFGLRGVLSGIRWNIKSKRNFILPSALNQDATRLRVKNDFNGVGGLFGLELDWKAPLGFGVNMRGAGSLIWGLSEEKTKQKYVFIPAGEEEGVHRVYRAGNSSHCLKALWELFIGGFWETDFSSKKAPRSLLSAEKKQTRKTSLRLLAGYELQHWPWFGQKTNVQSSRERERFSLGFQGFTGGAKLVF